MDSKVARDSRRALIAATLRLTPEERLQAFLRSHGRQGPRGLLTSEGSLSIEHRLARTDSGLEQDDLVLGIGI